LQGLSLHGSKTKLFQKRNRTPRNAGAKAFAEVKPNCFKKRNKTPRNARAKAFVEAKPNCFKKETKPQ
jgi:hypothetical protein